MHIKFLEIRDCGTLIPAYAVWVHTGFEPRVGQMYSMAQLRRDAAIAARGGCGVEGCVYLTRLADARTQYEPAVWGDRTMQTAHTFVRDNWNEIVSGQVVCVEHILGERDEPKVSELL